MGSFFKEISTAHKRFVTSQHMFFVGTAPLSQDGRINLSPKGTDSFKIFSHNKVGYMDLIGSGNETSAHTLENGRITFMFCSFGAKPLILRFYGMGKVALRDSQDWNEYSQYFDIYPSTRQLIIADIHLVQTSCGFGVPHYKFVKERRIHFDWADKKSGAEGFSKYMKSKNVKSIDDLDTDLGLSLLDES